jgi:hypothetical protein
MKNILFLASTLTLALGAIAQAGSWSFTVGDGSGFYYSNNQRQCAPVYSAPVYAAPAPVYYSRPVTYYQPQTVYMQPYQQMRPAPVYYSQPAVVYTQQPVIYRESHGHCGNRQRVSYPNRW